MSESYKHVIAIFVIFQKTFQNETIGVKIWLLKAPLVWLDFTACLLIDLLESNDVEFRSHLITSRNDMAYLTDLYKSFYNGMSNFNITIWLKQKISFLLFVAKLLLYKSNIDRSTFINLVNFINSILYYDLLIYYHIGDPPRWF